MVPSVPSCHHLVMVMFSLEKELQQLARYGVQHACNPSTEAER